RAGASASASAADEALHGAIAALPGVAAVARLAPGLRAEAGGPTLLYPDGARGAREARGWTVLATPSLADVLDLRFLAGGLPPAGGAPPPGRPPRLPD